MATIKRLMTMCGRSFWCGAVAVLALTAGGRTLDAQSLSYTSGQTVTPAYEGWEQDPDGSKYFVFGYMNKNWEEELDVPIGPANSFAPGDADRGQPTHFQPRRNRFVFRVPVPKGFSDKDELVWTLTTQGKTSKAYASLRTDYLIDDIVKASETGALGAGSSSPTIRANKPPTVRAEGPRQAKVGEWVSLVATLADDGIPKARSREEFLAVLARRAGALSPFGAPAAAPASGTPAAETPAAGAPAAATPAAGPSLSPALVNRLFLSPPNRITVGKNLGLHLSWIVYRGAGAVQFEQPQIKAWEDTRAGANSPWAPIWFAPPMPADGRITTRVQFNGPGTYVLRAVADDGALTGGESVTIVVKGPSN